MLQAPRRKTAQEHASTSNDNEIGNNAVVLSATDSNLEIFDLLDDRDRVQIALREAVCEFKQRAKRVQFNRADAHREITTQRNKE